LTLLHSLRPRQSIIDIDSEDEKDEKDEKDDDQPPAVPSSSSTVPVAPALPPSAPQAAPTVLGRRHWSEVTDQPQPTDASTDLPNSDFYFFSVEADTFPVDRASPLQNPNTMGRSMLVVTSELENLRARNRHRRRFEAVGSPHAENDASPPPAHSGDPQTTLCQDHNGLNTTLSAQVDGSQPTAAELSNTASASLDTRRIDHCGIRRRPVGHGVCSPNWDRQPVCFWLQSNSNSTSFFIRTILLCFSSSISRRRASGFASFDTQILEPAVFPFDC
jgi:hypothetical protein